MPFHLRISFNLMLSCAVLKHVCRFILYNKNENNFSSLLYEFSMQQEQFQPQVLVVGGLRMMLNFKEGEGRYNTSPFPFTISCCLTTLLLDIDD